MKRRQFIVQVAAAAVASMTARSAGLFASETPPQVALTFDDPNLNVAPRLTPDERNTAILKTLAEFGKLQAALFVCGQRVNSVAGRRLLRTWDEAGHILGNHSYSHLFLHADEVTVQTYAEDILRAEALLEKFPRFQKIFRYPYLKEGNTREKRDAVRTFLQEHGYRVGYASIDASDWYIDQRLRRRLAARPKADTGGYREYFVRHILDRAAFHDDLAKQVLGRCVKHTLVLHHNLLNALFLGDLLHALKGKGWQLINAQEAYTDPVFSMQPDIVPAGESIIWALAKETGKFDSVLRYPGEDGAYLKDDMGRLGL